MFAGVWPALPLQCKWVSGVMASQPEAPSSRVCGFMFFWELVLQLLLLWTSALSLPPTPHPGYILQPRDSCCSLLQCMQPPPLFVLILLSSPNLTSPSVVLFISRLQHTTHLYVTLKSPSLFFSLYFLQFCFTFFKNFILKNQINFNMFQILLLEVNTTIYTIIT